MNVASRDPVLTVRGLTVAFETNDGRVEAVRGVDFDVARGETGGDRGGIGLGQEPIHDGDDGAAGVERPRHGGRRSIVGATCSPCASARSTRCAATRSP